jgi:hypothetical protein
VPNAIRGPVLGSPRGVLEFRQRLEPFLGAARQSHLLVGELQGVVRNDNQASSHTQEATYRQNGIRLLAVKAHQEIANLTNGFVGIVDDIAANDLGRAIAGGQFLYIDLGEIYRLRRALRPCAARQIS